MAVEGVPLYIGGNSAQHSAEMLRLGNFFHFRGQEGWLTSTAGQVQTLATPGAGVTLMPGPFLINSRFPGGAMQSYMGRILTATDVPMTNVPPASSRSDLIVMNIEDPYPSDGVIWPYPGSGGTSGSTSLGPYVNIRVIENVPPRCLTLDDLDVSRPERGWTAIAAARIDRPANTGTVTADMIKPLRSVINPWAGIQLPQEILDNIASLDTAVSTIGDIVQGQLNQKIPVPSAKIDAVTCSASIASNTIFANNTSPKVWPQEANNFMIVPPWATHMRYYFQIIGAVCQPDSTSAGVNQNVYAGLNLSVGRASGPYSLQQFIEPNDQSNPNCPDKRVNRPPQIVNISAAGRMALDPRDVGRATPFNVKGYMLNGTGYQGKLICVPNVTQLYLSFQFLEGSYVV